MENQYNTPPQIIKSNVEGAVAKAELSWWRMLLYGIMAGAFIGFGAEASSLAMHAVPNFGLARTVAGVIFPVGLMLIVITGGELFTGNCLIAMAVYAGRVPCYKMVKNLVLVYISNFIGAALIAALVYAGGQFDFNAGAVGAFTIKVAAGKTAMSSMQCFFSGILCNCLVCLAIFLAAGARDIAGKCLAIFFPICAFVISGFEHCVANMYYLPAGLIAKAKPEYVQKAKELYGLTQSQIDQLDISHMFGNLFPVTVGNMVGGMLFIGLLYFVLHKKELKEQL